MAQNGLTNIGSNYVKGALGGGNGGSSAPQMPIGMMGASPMMSQASQPQMSRQPLNQTISRFKGYGRTPIQFRGATVWV
jgi:hypothetical protein